MSLFTLILPILLLILLDEYSLAQKTIPDEIREKVSQARTFSELLPVIQLSFAPHLLGNGGKSMLKHHKELQATEIGPYMNRTQNAEFLGFRGLDLSRKSNSQQTADGLFICIFHTLFYCILKKKIEEQKKSSIQEFYKKQKKEHDIIVIIIWISFTYIYLTILYQ
ncbi:unnamed protein product [Brugia timori]|uniref:Uncharacterized protein n=1 Tax=Brugia timori TaxID=42155 RepID=A0A0R3R0D9_9BILA|nr:unnamed protein product [Brugia timori]